MDENVNQNLINPAVLMGVVDILNDDDQDEAIRILVQNEVREHHPKVANYFEEVIPSYSVSDFKSHFRMTPTTFATLVDNIAPLLTPRNDGPNVLSPEKQVCIALWYFCNQDVYRSIADRFGVSINTSWRCTIKVACVLNELSADYIRWPQREELLRIEQAFREMAGFRNVVGAVDGTHIQISAPPDNAVSYINRKNLYSLNVQAICDCDLKFIDVFAGVCGSVHDARLWTMSDISAAMAEDLARFCPGEFHIIGDKAYGIEYYFMVPYKDNGHLTPTQVHFNYIHSKTRMVIERAFALLKGRFRRLKYLYLQKIRYGAIIIMACCVLHNICLDLDDEINEEILTEEDFVNDDIEEFRALNRRNDAATRRKRDAIAEMLMQVHERRN
ncbi:putative nuclease HARBI1 [Leptopilina boulardi]|uniref:putative nuclease HARBI1 n=1 Tax=Leptopilina boulardi TaxID=63433 RepID=UPI0021F51F8A|nr:putative nuclease HARBI1 [Leptopilina boulardi]